MDIKKILWPTDLSDKAGSALSPVTSLAGKYNAEVHVLYVIQEISYHKPWYGEFNKEHLEKIYQWEKASAEKHLNQICDKYLSGCPLFAKHTAIGDPAEEILRFIKERDIDIVTIAVQGFRGSFPFGSVAERVIKNATVPVLAIPVKG